MTDKISPDPFCAWFRALDDIRQERALAAVRNAAATVLASIVARKLAVHNRTFQRLPRGQPRRRLHPG